MDNLMWIIMFMGFGGLFIIWELADLISSKSSLIESQTRINDAQAELLEMQITNAKGEES